MLRKATGLMGCSIHATDGDIGGVTTMLFDDEGWTVRYFVVDTGKWLPGRNVLIAPVAIRQANWTGRALDVSLTREQVKNSPDIDTDRPVSRQRELDYYTYYGYPHYWGGVGLAPGAYAGIHARTDEARGMAEVRAVQEAGAPEDSHLRDASVVKGYHIRAADGEIGHVEDFLIDDTNWTIRYLVVDTSNWLGGRRVLIAPSWISAVSWAESKVDLTATRQAVKDSPEYDAAAEVSPDYEQRLYLHYGQQTGYRVKRDENRDRHGHPERSGGADRLARLDDLNDLEIATGDPDVRGWRVIASDGVAIGKVEHLIVDHPAMKVRFLEVGLERGDDDREARDVLIPLEHVDLADANEEVRLLGVASAQVSSLPTFEGLPIDSTSEERFRGAFAARAGGGNPRRDVRLGRHAPGRPPFTGAEPAAGAAPSSAVTPGREHVVNRSSDARKDATVTRDPRLDDEDPEQRRRRE